MFTKNELLEKFESLHLKPLNLLHKELSGYSSHPSVSFGSEQAYFLYRGRVQDFEGTMQFYCNSIFASEEESNGISIWETTWQGWVRDEIQAALCQPLSWYEFVPQAERILRALRDSVELPTMDEFVGAMLMQDEWNDIVVLAEFKNEYIYMQWFTSA